MINAERCRARAARYRQLALEVKDAEAQRALTALAAIWRDLEPVAETFDRDHDLRTRDMIYAMIDTIGEARRKVA